MRASGKRKMSIKGESALGNVISCNFLAVEVDRRSSFRPQLPWIIKLFLKKTVKIGAFSEKIVAVIKNKVLRRVRECFSWNSLNLSEEFKAVD